MILIILVCVFAVALVVETVYFNFQQVRRIDNDIKVRDEFLDLLFKRVKKDEEKMDEVIDEVNSTSKRLDSSMEKHDNLVDIVFDDIVPVVEQLTIKKPTKATKKEKVAKKKAGRPRKNK